MVESAQNDATKAEEHELIWHFTIIACIVIDMRDFSEAKGKAQLSHLWPRVQLAVKSKEMKRAFSGQTGWCTNKVADKIRYLVATA